MAGEGGTVCITPAHINFLSEEIVLFVSGSKVNDKRERSHNLPKAKVLILLKCKKKSEGKEKNVSSTGNKSMK